MNPEDKISLDQIKQLADDVRTIEKFQSESVNNGFKASIFNVAVVPNSKNRFDVPLIVAICCSFIILAIIIAELYYAFSKPIPTILFLTNTGFAIVVTIAMHVKFNKKTVTTITAIGLFVILFVGFGVLTPKEAVDSVKQFVK